MLNTSKTFVLDNNNNNDKKSGVRNFEQLKFKMSKIPNLEINQRSNKERSISRESPKQSIKIDNTSK